MSKVFIEEETLIGIGNAIREKNGTTDLIATTDMATAIRNLATGGGELKYNNTLTGTPVGTQGKTVKFNVSSIFGTEEITTPFIIVFRVLFSSSGSPNGFTLYYDGAGNFTKVYQQQTKISSVSMEEGVITVAMSSTMYFNNWLGTGKQFEVIYCE